MSVCTLLLLFVVGTAYGDKVGGGGVDFSGCVDDGEGRCCIIKEELVESVQTDKVLECTHKNVEKCHYTYVTVFKPTREEVCRENFQKKCAINFSKKVVRETVQKCYKPLKKVCGGEVRRKRQGRAGVECRTFYQSSCTTRYVRKGQAGKFVADTQCEKVPVKLCGRGCQIVEQPKECHDKVIDTIIEVPEETCDLNPVKSCQFVTKLVPRLNPSHQCTTIPQEVCVLKQDKPRNIKKPLRTKWCLEKGEDSQRSETRADKVDNVTRKPQTKSNKTVDTNLTGEQPKYGGPGEGRDNEEKNTSGTDKTLSSHTTVPANDTPPPTRATAINIETATQETYLPPPPRTTQPNNNPTEAEIPTAYLIPNSRNTDEHGLNPPPRTNEKSGEEMINVVSSASIVPVHENIQSVPPTNKPDLPTYEVELPTSTTHASTSVKKIEPILPSYKTGNATTVTVPKINNKSEGSDANSTVILDGSREPSGSKPQYQSETKNGPDSNDPKSTQSFNYLPPANPSNIHSLKSTPRGHDNPISDTDYKIHNVPGPPPQKNRAGKQFQSNIKKTKITPPSKSKFSSAREKLMDQLGQQSNKGKQPINKPAIATHKNKNIFPVSNLNAKNHKINGHLVLFNTTLPKLRKSVKNIQNNPSDKLGSQKTKVTFSKPSVHKIEVKVKTLRRGQESGFNKKLEKNNPPKISPKIPVTLPARRLTTERRGKTIAFSSNGRVQKILKIPHSHVKENKPPKFKGEKNAPVTRTKILLNRHSQRKPRLKTKGKQPEPEPVSEPELLEEHEPQPEPEQKHNEEVITNRNKDKQVNSFLQLKLPNFGLTLPNLEPIDLKTEPQPEPENKHQTEVIKNKSKDKNFNSFQHLNLPNFGLTLPNQKPLHLNTEPQPEPGKKHHTDVIKNKNKNNSFQHLRLPNFGLTLPNIEPLQLKTKKKPINNITIVQPKTTTILPPFPLKQTHFNSKKIKTTSKKQSRQSHQSSSDKKPRTGRKQHFGSLPSRHTQKSNKKHRGYLPIGRPERPKKPKSGYLPTGQATKTNKKHTGYLPLGPPPIQPIQKVSQITTSKRKKEPPQTSLSEDIPEEDPPFYNIPANFPDKLPEYIRPVPEHLAALQAFSDTSYESYRELRYDARGSIAPANNPYAAPYPKHTFSQK